MTRGNDGTVRVTIRQVGAIDAVNARLAALGVRARFVAAAAGCADLPSSAVAHLVTRNEVRVESVSVARGLVHARLDPRKIPAGQTLVFRAWREGGVVKASSGPVVRGTAPACLPVPATAALHAGQKRAIECLPKAAPPSGNSGNTGNSGSPPAAKTGPITEIAPAPTGASGNGGAPPATVHVYSSSAPIDCPASADRSARKALANARRAASRAR